MSSFGGEADVPEKARQRLLLTRNRLSSPQCTLESPALAEATASIPGVSYPATLQPQIRIHSII